MARGGRFQDFRAAEPVDVRAVVAGDLEAEAFPAVGGEDGPGRLQFQAVVDDATSSRSEAEPVHGEVQGGVGEGHARAGKRPEAAPVSPCDSVRSVLHRQVRRPQHVHLLRRGVGGGGAGGGVEVDPPGACFRWILEAGLRDSVVHVRRAGVEGGGEYRRAFLLDARPAMRRKRQGREARRQVRRGGELQEVNTPRARGGRYPVHGVGHAGKLERRRRRRAVRRPRAVDPVAPHARRIIYGRADGGAQVGGRAEVDQPHPHGVPRSPTEPGRKLENGG